VIMMALICIAMRVSLADIRHMKILLGKTICYAHDLTLKRSWGVIAGHSGSCSAFNPIVKHRQ
jgi:hypothetical protein